MLFKVFWNWRLSRKACQTCKLNAKHTANKGDPKPNHSWLKRTGYGICTLLSGVITPIPFALDFATSILLGTMNVLHIVDTSRPITDDPEFEQLLNEHVAALTAEGNSEVASLKAEVAQLRSQQTSTQDQGAALMAGLASGSGTNLFSAAQNFMQATNAAVGPTNQTKQHSLKK